MDICMDTYNICILVMYKNISYIILIENKFIRQKWSLFVAANSFTITKYFITSRIYECKLY